MALFENNAAQATLATIRLIAGELKNLVTASPPVVPTAVYNSYEQLTAAYRQASQAARDAAASQGLNSTAYQTAANQAKVLANQINGINGGIAKTGDEFAVLSAQIASLARQSQGGLGSILTTMLNLGAGITGLVAPFGAALAAGSLFYATLIAPAEAFNRQILSNKAVIASFVDVTDSLGNRLTDPKAKIEAQGEEMRRLLLKLEKDAQNLPGVTTSTLNEIFSGVVSNIGFVLNQTRGASGSIQEQLQEVSVGFAAASSIIGISGAELQQVITGLFSNNFTNENTLITRLGFTKEGIEQARAQGRQIEYIRETLSPLIVAAELGSNSISALSVNFVDLFENLSKLAGQNLIDPIAKPLGEFFKYLNSPDVKQSLEEFAQGFGEGLAGFIEQIKTLIEAVVGIPGVVEVATGVWDNFTSILSFVRDALTLAIQGLTDLALWLTGVIKAASNIPILGDILNQIGENAKNAGGALNTVRSAIQQLTGVAKANTEALAVYSQNISKLSLDAAKLSARIKQLQAQGVTDSSKELQILRQQLKAVLAELDKNRKDAKGLSVTSDAEIAQVEALDQQVKALSTDFSKLVSGDANLVLKILPNLGSAAEITGLRWKNLVREFNAPVNVAQLVKTSQEITKLATQAFSLGQVDLSTVVSQLQAIVADQRSGNAETALAANKALLEIYELEASAKRKLLDIDKARLDLQIARGDIFEEERAVQQLAIKYDELAIALENAKRKADAAKDIGNVVQAREAASEIAKLQIEIDKIKFDKISADFKANLASIDRSVAKTNSQISLLASQRLDERQTFLGQLALAEQSASDQIIENRNKLFVVSEQLKLLETQKPVNLKEQFELEQKIAKLKVDQLNIITQQVQIQARAEIAYRKELLNLEQTQFSFISQSFDRQLKFNTALAGLEQSRIKAKQAGLQSELAGYNRVAELRNILASQEEKNLTEQEKAAKAEVTAEREKRVADFARFALSEQGVAFAFNEVALAQRKFEIVQAQVKLERESIEAKLKADRSSLEITLQKQKIEAESKLNEAQQKALDAQIKLIDLQKQADIAKKNGDTAGLALIQKQIGLQQGVIGLADQQVNRSQQNITDQDILGNVERARFDIDAQIQQRQLRDQQNTALQQAQIEAIRGGAVVSFEPVRTPSVQLPNSNFGQNATAIANQANIQQQNTAPETVVTGLLSQTNALIREMMQTLNSRLNSTIVNNNYQTSPDPRQALRLLGQ